MTTNELEHLLNYHNVPLYHYCIGDYKDMALCLIQEDGLYHIFECERGQRYDEKTFVNESQAVRYFISQISVYFKPKNEPIISKDTIRNGLKYGYIQLMHNPDATDNTVCKIGDNWFNIGGEAEVLSPEDFIEEEPFENIVDTVFNTLDAFRISGWDEFTDEYEYYESWLELITSQEKYVVSTLEAAKAAYRRIPKSLWFEIFRNDDGQFSVLKITDSGDLELDNKIITNKVFTAWVDIKAKKGELL